MTVAILIPTHNRADTIGAAIESCLRQEEDGDVFVLDDGGADHDAVDPYWQNGIADYRRIPKDAANEPGVRNKLIAWWGELHGGMYPYACWLDSDDLMAPERIAVQRAYLDAHPDVDLVFSDMLVFDGTPENVLEIRSVNPAYFGKSLDGYRTLVSPTAMFRPSVRAVPFDEKMIHGGCDKLWLFTLIQQGFKVATIRQPLYYLREHPGRLTRQREQMPKESLKPDLDHFYAEIERMGGTR